MTTVTALERFPRRAGACMVPRPTSPDGVFEVDATWGSVQPIALAAGVRTVGELEVIEHLEHGALVVDTRQPQFHRAATIPGAVNLPHQHILDHIGELARDRATVFFCNGPQCAATPDAVRALLGAGHPAGAILYYRGGMHDWITLGYPTVPGPDGPARG